MKLKTLFLGLLVILTNAFIITSCSEDENLEALEQYQKSQINQETMEFKNNLVTTFKNKKETKSGEISLNQEQISLLRNDALVMLKSQGFEESDFEEFMEERDPRIILFAAMYMGLIENNSSQIVRKVTRNSEDVDGDGTCYSVARITVCAGRALLSAIGADEIKNMFSGYACITKTIAKSVFKSLLKKVPWIAAAVALDTFIDCMGWYPWN